MSAIFTSPVRSGLSVFVISSSLALAGCTSFSGLDGSSSYGCKAPEGVKCDSVSGTYYNSMANNLPSQRRSSTPSSQTAPVDTAPSYRPVSMSTATSPSSPGASVAAAPLRSQPRILRLWIKPWEDADRDLNGESLVFVQVDNGQWLVDRAQRLAREPYAPVKAPKRQLPAAAAGASSPNAASGDAASVAQALRARQAANQN
ncbi:TraV family lipoprotein [Piscinibacter gummiphilus]|uniref:TraV family lipoprotein n=1 Tax=Piscinibacter gummiphilus TaxID=946333 RepID=A0ABZ0D1S2_9BURK|nr:TraV family lipoprotein [Piscinibacter gummiphilus]WOB11134.1 TraV family lipoprotein [Piscinibacter gummiphilus]